MDAVDIDISLYEYDLPKDRIAQVPAERRDGSRLLVLDRSREDLELAAFREIGRFFRPGDLLVLNDTRVFPARLRCRRATGGRIEALLLAPAENEPFLWNALLRPAKGARRAGEIAVEGGGGAALRALRDAGDGQFLVEVIRGGRPLSPGEVFALCDEAGEIPLPPYITRAPGDPRGPLDRERYQTVYARIPGAAAAPTAGLHFTRDLLAELERQGIEIASLTLAVGLGTFQPVREEALRAGRLHAEEVSLGSAAGERILKAREEGRRIVAVGTTTARALESWALAGNPLPEHGWKARTDLLIAPGFRFALTGCLVTNFHLPRSSLLLLVSALAGRERILAAYRQAIAAGFRFYSYGDAMLIL